MMAGGERKDFQYVPLLVVHNMIGLHAETVRGSFVDVVRPPVRLIAKSATVTFFYSLVLALIRMQIWIWNQ